MRKKINKTLLEIIKSKPKPTTKQLLEALEYDFCSWLKDNRALSYEKRNSEILETFDTPDFPNHLINELAAHMLLRMDDAHNALEMRNKFEPFIKAGIKAERNRRKGPKIASKKRTEKADENTAIIKTKIKEIFQGNSISKKPTNKHLARDFEKAGFGTYESLLKTIGRIMRENKKGIH